MNAMCTGCNFILLFLTPGCRSECKQGCIDICHRHNLKYICMWYVCVSQLLATHQHVPTRQLKTNRGILYIEWETELKELGGSF